MRPTALTLEGFQSAADEVSIDLSSITAAAIVGHNGAGKSTLVDAIVFAITGEVRTNTLAEAITTGLDVGRVELRFDHNDSSYRIERRIKRTAKGASQTVEFERADPDSPSGWVQFGTADKSTRSTNTEITAVIGVSTEVLLATAVARQGDIGRFAAMPPKDRKDLLWSMLGLSEQYDPLAETARSNSQDAKRDLDRLTSRSEQLSAERDQLADEPARLDEAKAGLAQNELLIADIDNQLADARRNALQRVEAEAALTAARTEVKRLGADREAERGRLTAELETVGATLARLTARRQTARDQLDAATKSAERLELLEATLTTKQRELDAANARLADVLKEGADANAGAVACDPLLDTQRSLIADLEAGIAALDRGDHTCVACGSTLDAAGVAERRKDIDHQAAAARREIRRLDATKAEHSQNRQRLLVEHRELTAKIQQLGQDVDKGTRVVATAEADAGRIGDLAGEVFAFNEEHDALREQQATKQNRWGELTEPGPAEVEAAEAVTAAVAALDAIATVDVDVLGVQRRKAEDQRVALERAATAAGIAVARLDTIAAELDAIAADLAAAKARTDTQATLARAFGRDGVPALVMENVCGEITAVANDVLSKLSSGSMSVRVTTTGETAAGTRNDRLTIYVAGADGERSIESFSGGERLRVDIALRAALTIVLFGRQGSHFDMFISDEGWGALDTDGTSAAIDSLVGLTEHFGLVLTITHVDEIADAMPHRIHVAKNATNSTELTVQ